MITKEQIIPLLLKASPSFQQAWDEHKKDYDEELIYVALGSFADHLLTLYQNGQVNDFPLIASVIERLHTEGDASTKEAATIGLLEGIQNVWGNKKVDPEKFYPFLLPESQKWWGSLNKFWNREIKFVGEDIASQGT